MKRPKIPAEIARLVLIESGHRCAVDGTPCSLEKAHIRPWRESHDHSVENLICLCANCHERADRENWGETVLRAYKETPWVLRSHPSSPEGEDFAIIEFAFEKVLRQFDGNQELIFRYALAKFLDIDPDAIKIVRKKQ